jgi:hypothetical protein
LGQAKALETAGILSWVNRIHRVGTRERDLFGYWTTTWRVLRTSNAYVIHYPKAAERQGRPSNTEIRCGPPDRKKEKGGAPLAAARVIQAETFPAPPEQRDPLPAIGLQTLSQTVEMLREDVGHERDRADQAERRIDELQTLLTEERRRIDGLHADLADARTAAMITGCEAAALRAENALLKARPWWRRWWR